jgi:hypothetical protein
LFVVVCCLLCVVCCCLLFVVVCCLLFVVCCLLIAKSGLLESLPNMQQYPNAFGTSIDPICIFIYYFITLLGYYTCLSIGVLKSTEVIH